MKRTVILAFALLCLTLTGCSAAAFFLSGCGSPDAGLVVINSSAQAVWSIELEHENGTQGVRSARDRALLEQGQTYGLELEEGAVTVILSGRYGRELGRMEVEFSGERLYLTLEENGELMVSEEWNDG